MNFFKKTKKGFTLVELVVVIAVIAILAAVSVGAYFGVTESANNSRLEQETKQLHTAISTVALSHDDHSSLGSNGLIITDPGKFEKKLEENLGKEIFITDVENSKHEELPTVCFSNGEYSGRLGGTTVYKTFQYHIPGIEGKKTIANVVSGDLKIEKDITTTVANPFESKVWHLVKNVNELSVGDSIVIVAKDYNYALGSEEKAENRPAVSIGKTDNLVSIDDTILTIDLEAGAMENSFAFKTKLGYLYAASSSKNYLKTKTELDENASWSIEIGDGNIATIVGQGDNTRNTLKYNHSSKLFSCYESTASMQDILIYRAGYEFDAQCKHNFGDNLKECIECGAPNPNYIAPIEPAVNTATVEQLSTYEITNQVAYNTTGYIIGWYANNNNIHKQGRFYLADSLSDNIDNAIIVYGASTFGSTLTYDETGYNFDNSDPDTNLDVSAYKIGDKVSLKGYLFSYESANGLIREFNGVISVHESQNLSLNVTHNENTTNHTFSSVIKKVEIDVVASEVVSATVTNNDQIIYEFESFTVDQSGKREISFDFLNKTIDGVCTIPEGQNLSILNLSDESNIASSSSEQQVWTNGFVTLTNNKGNSTNDVAAYAPIRIYTNSEVIIELNAGNIEKIEFSINDNKDGAFVEDLLCCTTNKVDNIITIELSKPCKEIRFNVRSQLKLNSINVYYNSENALEPEIVAISADDINLTNYNLQPLTIGSVLSNLTKGNATFDQLEFTYDNKDLFTISEEGIQLKEGIVSGNETVSVALKDNDTIFTSFVVSIEVDLTEPKAIFEFGENITGNPSHKDGSSIGNSKTYEQDGYSLVIESASNVYDGANDSFGNSCLKLGTSSKAGSFNFTVPSEITKVEIYVARYKTNESKVNLNGTEYTLSKNSDAGEYDVIIIDTSISKTISFKSGIEGDKRCMINTIIFK